MTTGFLTIRRPGEEAACQRAEEIMASLCKTAAFHSAGHAANRRPRYGWVRIRYCFYILAIHPKALQWHLHRAMSRIKTGIHFPYVTYRLWHGQAGSPMILVDVNFITRGTLGGDSLKQFCTPK